MGTLISSKVNQWTLLIGMLPLAYGLSAGNLQAPMQLDARQAEEILLTAAQSLFAVVILADFRFALVEAGIVFLLFAVQMPFTDPHTRYYFSFLYLALTVAMLALRPELRWSLPAVFRPFPRARR
jgi:cation:H+ antiporter